MSIGYCFRAAAREAQRGLRQQVAPVLLVTDPERLPGPERIVRHLPDGWGVIYRHFGESGRERRLLALQEAARRRRICVWVSADMSWRCDTDGLHWPEQRWRSQAGRIWRRRWLGKGKRPVVSVSAHDRRALAPGVLRGADMVLVSPVFASSSPSIGRGGRGVLGRRKFRSLSARSVVPCYALGGISEGRHVLGSPFAALGSIRDLFGQF